MDRRRRITVGVEKTGRCLAGFFTVEFEQVSLSDKLDQLRVMLSRQPQLNFSALFAHARTRLEAVVTFLALLELIRIGEARVRQSSAFAEIMVEAREEQRKLDD